MLDTIKVALIYCIVESRDLLNILLGYVDFDRRYKSFLEKIPQYDVYLTRDGYVLVRVEKVPPPDIE